MTCSDHREQPRLDEVLRGRLGARAKPEDAPGRVHALVARLNERDLRTLSVDRNVPEGLRIAARRLLTSNESRRK